MDARDIGKHHERSLTPQGLFSTLFGIGGLDVESFAKSRSLSPGRTPSRE